jgi:AhpC/TSA family
MISTFTGWALASGIVAIGATIHQEPPPAQPPTPLVPTLKAGDVAPAFALQGSDGKVHRLSDYKGKTVIIAWFPKAFTGG